MARFKIVPRRDIYIEDVEADSPEDALAKFAAGMDTDMNIYFSAEPAEMTDEEAKKEGKKPFWVTHKIDARWVKKVFAADVDEARRASNNEFLDADFGEAEDIDGEAIIVEDENGDYVWEK